ncbi:MAG: hypothetical protein KDC26_01670 [Armatimonadetes bacterium]|nr:hypothetical protein [Armatimonadota bacterium]
MRKKIFVVVAVVLGIFAAWGLTSGSTKSTKPEEKWLEDQLITEVGEFELVNPMDDNPKISYKMDESSYEALEPIGMACQRMSDDRGRLYDVVIIAADSMKALHDQTVCFRAQGYELYSDEIKPIQSDVRGQYPAIFSTIRRDGGPMINAILAFRSPRGMVTYNRAKVDFFLYQLQKGQPGRGFSYRFMGLDETITMEDLEFFARNYMDKLYEESEGKV